MKTSLFSHPSRRAAKLVTMCLLFAGCGKSRDKELDGLQGVFAKVREEPAQWRSRHLENCERVSEEKAKAFEKRKLEVAPEVWMLERELPNEPETPDGLEFNLATKKLETCEQIRSQFGCIRGKAVVLVMGSDDKQYRVSPLTLDLPADVRASVDSQVETVIFLDMHSRLVTYNNRNGSPAATVTIEDAMMTVYDRKTGQLFDRRYFGKPDPDTTTSRFIGVSSEILSSILAMKKR